MIRKFSKNLQSGIGLIAVLVLIAIVGILATVIARLGDSAMFVNMAAQSNADVNALTGEIRRLLSDPAICRANFQNRDARSASTTQLVDRTGTSVYSVGGTYGGLKLPIQSMQLIDNPGSGDGVEVVAGGMGTTNFVFGITRKLGPQRKHIAQTNRTIRLAVQSNATFQILNCQALSSGEENIWERNPSDLTQISFNDGFVGVGQANPAARLDIAGEVKIGDENGTCNSPDDEGKIRYRDRSIWYCDGISWKTRPLPQMATVNQCQWTNYLNDWDQSFDYYCPGDKSMVGIESYHNSGREDRRFRFLCCNLQIDNQNATRSSCSSTEYVNEYDQKLNFTCPFEMVMVGMKSKHNSGREDRQFGFHCCRYRASGLRLFTRECSISGYVNNYDSRANYSCTNSSVMVGQSSVHDSGREDRRFSHHCCSYETN